MLDLTVLALLSKGNVVDLNGGGTQRKAKLCGERLQGRLKPRALLGFAAGGNPEGHTPVVVRFGRGGQVKIRQRNLFGVAGSKIPKRLADDGIILNFFLMLIAEDQYSGGHDLGSLCRCLRFEAGGRTRRGIRASVGITISIGLFLASHLLLSEALLVHLVGEG